MSMHLVGTYTHNTIQSQKETEKMTAGKLQRLQQQHKEHNKHMKQLGLS